MAGYEIRAQLVIKGKELRLEKQVNFFTQKNILFYFVFTLL